LGGWTAVTYLKRPYVFALLLPYSLVTLVLPSAASLIPSRVIAISAPQTPVQSEISGSNWHYDVPFPVEHIVDINKLIQCESQGVNVSRPDSNGLISDGILQFNRGPSDVLGSGTWTDMEQRFGFYGSPIVPQDAIRMADMMIGAGLIGRWTCARIQKLLK
jgi:hypothetical protein